MGEKEELKKEVITTRGHFAEDLTGMTFGYNLVKSRAPNYYRPSDIEKKYPRAVWTCECLLCGTIKNIRSSHLKSGRVVSCGCLGLGKIKKAKTTHDKSKTKIYGVWQNIKNRCYNKNTPCYERYGARGIYVCDEWLNDFMAFYDWCIENGYNEKAEHMQCQIDRIDNNGPYAPWNCRFVTAKENANNRRVGIRDKQTYKVFSITATRFEWRNIINTNEYRIKTRAEEWNIPVEMFILYVIERNAGLVKKPSKENYDPENFIKLLTKVAEDENYSGMTQDQFKTYIAGNLKKKE